MYSLPKESLLVLVLNSDLDSLQNLSITNEELNFFLNDKYVLKQLSIQHEVPTSDSLQQLHQLSTESLGKKLLYAVKRKDYDSVIRMLEIQDQTISKEEYEAVLAMAKRSSSYSILNLLYHNRSSVLEKRQDLVSKQGVLKRTIIFPLSANSNGLDLAL